MRQGHPGRKAHPPTKTSSRSFHPLVYCFGEGEREIVALHAFLNLKVALKRLFGIHNVVFKRGLVSDASPVFVNSVATAFAGTPLLQCYPHIIRKFKVQDRKGNGGYKMYLSKDNPQQWMTEEAEPAIRRCSLCKTKAQRDKMWSLTREKWTANGESVMAETFQKQYIDDEHYTMWWYSVSGYHGCVPCNNPMERHNLFIKGTPDFLGFVEIGRDMLSMLTVEFVKLIYMASTELSNPKDELPLLDFNKAYSNDLFMEFSSIFDPSVDMREYGGGWLVNDLRHLSKQILDTDIAKMEMALAGIIEEGHDGEDMREELLNRTQRFHHVVEAKWKEGPEMPERKYFKCDCREFYFHRSCFQSLWMQHQEELKLLGDKIKRKGPVSNNISKNSRVKFELYKARKRISNKKFSIPNEGSTTTTINVATNEVGPVMLTQDEEET